MKKKKQKSKLRLNKEQKRKKRMALRQKSSLVSSDDHRDFLYDLAHPSSQAALEEITGRRSNSLEDLVKWMAKSVSNSHEIADEPEFQDFMFPVVQMHKALDEAMEELGDVEDLGKLPADVREERSLRVRQYIARALITQDKFEDILRRLTRIEKRARAEANLKLMAESSALLEFIKEVKSIETLVDIGLFSALLLRTGKAGDALAEMVEDLSPEQRRQISEDPEAMTSFIRGHVLEKAKKIPGFFNSLRQDVDIAWEEGINSLMKAEWSMHLFSMDEFEEFTAQSAGQSMKKFQPSKFIDAIEQYIEGWMTPENLARIDARLTELIKDPEYKGYVFFMMNLSSDVKEAENDLDTREYLRYTLTKIFFGELRFMAEVINGDHEDEDEDDE